MAITRTAWIDDDGSGTTGTVLNNAEKTLFYDQIDASKLDLTGDKGMTGAITFAADSSAVGPSIFRQSNTFVFRGGTSGFSYQNQAGVAIIASLSNAGILNVGGQVKSTSAVSTVQFAAIPVVNTHFAIYEASNIGGSTYLGVDDAASYFGGVGAYASILYAGGDGGLALKANHASGSIRFYSGGGTLRMQILPSGEVVSGLHGSCSLGTAANSWGNFFLYAPAVTGTALYVSAANKVGPLSSSARFKEHIQPWRVTPDDVNRFLDVQPQSWDYIDQESGAAGFIAEDLEAVPIRNAYGRSPLINYDADGRPISNRDYAIIGLQHLVLQDLSRRVAALEGSR